MDLGSPDLAPRAPLTRHPPAPPDLNLRSRTCLRVPPEGGEARGAAIEESPRQPATRLPARLPARLPSVPESPCPAGANASVITASVTTAAVIRNAMIRAAGIRAAVIGNAEETAAEVPAAEEPQPGGIAARGPTP